MDSFLNDINSIYLKLKKKDYSELSKNPKIINIVEQIQKNEYSDVQLYVIAKLLCYLLNIEKLNKRKFIYLFNDRFNKNKMRNIWKKLYEEYKLNTTTLNSKIKKILNNVTKNIKSINENKRVIKIDIILRFIDEYIEVSRENSEYSKELQEFLKNLEFHLFSFNNLQKKNELYPSRASSASNAFGISSQASASNAFGISSQASASNAFGISSQASASNAFGISSQASAAFNSTESFNMKMQTIQAYIYALKSNNIGDVIQMIINSNIFSIKTEEFSGKIPIFLSKIFNYIIQYIDNDMLKKILIYIVYFFVNQNMEIPKDILESFGAIYLEQFKDKELFKILREELPEFSKNEKLVKLFYLLSLQIIAINQIQASIKKNNTQRPQTINNNKSLYN
jgi:hypothetical protein